MLVTTVLNAYVISDDFTQWYLAMMALPLYVLIFAAFDYYETKNKTALIVAIIFFSEFIAVIFGFNLKTDYYTEFVILLLFFGIYSFLKNVSDRI